MKPSDDELYTLRILEGKKVREIAAYYHVPYSTVGTWLKAAELVEVREHNKPDKAQLKQDYKEATGNKRQWIAEKYGVHEKTACLWLRQYGIDGGFQKLMTYEQCLEAIDMRESGKQAGEIAAHFGVGNATVVRYMRKYDLFTTWRSVISSVLRQPSRGNKEEMTFKYLYRRRIDLKWTYQEIADDFGCSVWKVQTAMKRFGLLQKEEGA